MTSATRRGALVSAAAATAGRSQARRIRTRAIAAMARLPRPPGQAPGRPLPGQPRSPGRRWQAGVVGAAAPAGGRALDDVAATDEVGRPGRRRGSAHVRDLLLPDRAG